MAATLVLVRHGNTFNEGDKVVWCGARTDLPLTAAGEEQARALGRRMRELDVFPDRVMHGPLQRTVRAAELISAEAGWDVMREVNVALREIDYGAWEALSTEEIEALGGGAELEAWNKGAVWPKAPGWTPVPMDISESVARVMEDAAQGGVTVAVTSNGIMRFFGLALPEEVRPAKLKVGTGGVCVLRHEGGAWRVVGWNLGPGEVAV